MKIAEQWETLTRAQSNVPVDVFSLPNKLGINFKEAHLVDGISGMLEKTASTFLITINAPDPLTRKRFTLAHELGHYMLHRHLVGDGLDDDKAYRSTNLGKYHNTLIGPAEETEANKFAANLLMPRHLINSELKKRKGTEPNVDDEVIHEMATLFAVSEQAMSIRLGK